MHIGSKDLIFFFIGELIDWKNQRIYLTQLLITWYSMEFLLFCFWIKLICLRRKLDHQIQMFVGIFHNLQAIHIPWKMFKILY